MESFIIAILVLVILAVVITKAPIDPTMKWIGQLICGVGLVYIAFKLVIGVG